MKQNTRILLVEDVPRDQGIIIRALRQGRLPFRSTCVDTKEAFLQELEHNLPDVIISDLSLPSFDGHAALALARQKCPEVPFIFVTRTRGDPVAIRISEDGATDYVLKNGLSRLVPTVNRALRAAAKRSAVRRAKLRPCQLQEQLRALSIQLQQARETERTRIAREVHDELGQALTALKLQLRWLANRLPENSQILHQGAMSMAERIDLIIQAVRRIATELRPGILDAAGLVPALEWQATEFQNQTGIPCRVKATVHQASRDQERETALFRIFQETLTNIIRHARATRVEVRLAETPSHLIMEIKDNGRGISEAEIHGTRSVGLLGMRERAALLGGEVRVSGAPNNGTTVSVRIPLAARARKTRSA